MNQTRSAKGRRRHWQLYGGCIVLSWAAWSACSPPNSSDTTARPATSTSADASAAPSASNDQQPVRGQDDMPLYRVAPRDWTYGWASPPEGAEAIEARPETRATYWVDAAPVSALQYLACIESEACPALPEPNAYARQHCTGYNTARLDAPINCVTREEAAGYCAWTGRRLMTDVEWELAARGDSARKLPDGWDARPARDHESRTLGAASIREGRSTWAGDERFHGLGQVREWTAGLFEPGVDSRMRLLGGEAPVSTRGVAWNEDHASPLMARWMTDPSARSPAVGFRCAVSDPQLASARCTAARCRPTRPEEPVRAWGDRLDNVEDDGIGSRVLVPAGDVEVPLPRLVRDDERRTRVPTRVGAFRIDRTPVTVSAMRACVRAGVCVEPSRYVHGPWCTWGQVDWHEHPMTCTTSSEAEAFCAWVGGRLPTEVEWLRAVFGDGVRRWPWGPDASEGRSNLRHPNPEETDPDGWPFTSPVGAFPQDRSPYGLLDAGGNVSEWVREPISPWATPQNPAQREPTGVGLMVEGADTESTHRVLGLSWMHTLEDDGREYTLMTRPDTIGFRCAWDVDAGDDRPE